MVTVCDNARDACPVFPARTQRLHWSFEDPAAVEGTEAERLEVLVQIGSGVDVGRGRCVATEVQDGVKS